eukprot:3956985-Alexandrium_andersonii.AAC.1
MEMHLKVNRSTSFMRYPFATAMRLRHGRECQTTSEPTSRLRMAVAGTMCTPWSSRGLRRGLSDEATEPWH